jgi:hypothetical protein
VQPSAAGHPVHTRSLTVTVTRPEAGVYAARGDVIDLRKTSFTPVPDRLQTAGIIHHMQLRTRLDAETRELLSVETEQPVVAFEPSPVSGGECCRDPAPRLHALAGQRLDADFRKKLGASFGGPRGCSHLLTLFHLLASALPQVLDAEEALGRPERGPGEMLFQRSLFIDGFQRDGTLQVVAQVSDYHTRAAAGAVTPLDRFGWQHEAHIGVLVGLDELEIREVSASERRRTADTIQTAEWRDRSTALRDLEGRRIMPGLGGHALRLLGEDPEARLLLDAALNLAPGFVQCMAVLTEKFLTTPRHDDEELPDLVQTGGLPDSCYMWRSDGAMIRLRGGTT